MSKPRTQQVKRNAQLPSQREPEPRQVFGRYFDRVHRRWVMLTSDGPIPEAPSPAVRVDL